MLTSAHPRAVSFPATVKQSESMRFLQVDLVTETDQKCEALLLERLRAAAADYRFIGEQLACSSSMVARDQSCGCSWDAAGPANSVLVSRCLQVRVAFLARRARPSAAAAMTKLAQVRRRGGVGGAGLHGRAHGRADVAGGPARRDDQLRAPPAERLRQHRPRGAETGAQSRCTASFCAGEV